MRYSIYIVSIQSGLRWRIKMTDNTKNERMAIIGVSLGFILNCVAVYHNNLMVAIYGSTTMIVSIIFISTIFLYGHIRGEE